MKNTFVNYEDEWNKLFESYKKKYPADAEKFVKVFNNDFGNDWVKALPTFNNYSEKKLFINQIFNKFKLEKVDDDDNKDNDFIPVPLGQGALLKADKLLNDLLGNVWFEIRKNVVIFSKDILLTNL